MGSAQQEVGYSGLFKNHMLWNLKYSSQDFQHRSTKLCERVLKTLGMLNCGGIFDISNGLPVARRWSYGRELRDRKCLIKSTYIVWFWSQFSGLFRCMKPIASMWQLWGKVIAPTNWQQEVCDFQNALNSPSYFYPICFKLNQNTVKTWPMWNSEGNIDI